MSDELSLLIFLIIELIRQLILNPPEPEHMLLGLTSVPDLLEYKVGV